MEQVLARLKEAAEIKNGIAKQEAAFWEKIAEAIGSFVESQKQLVNTKKDTPSTIAPPSPHKIERRDFMTSIQAGEYLGISKKTLEMWRVRGNGPKYVKVGHAVRYKAHDLDAFIEQNKYPHTSAYKARN